MNMNTTQSEQDQATPRLIGTNLSYRINNTNILTDVSIRAMPGELLGLIGPNGAGKSTLLSLLAGLATCSAGSISVDGNLIDDFNTATRARTIGWLEQIGEIHWPLTVHRLVSLGRLPHLATWQKFSESDELAVQQALEKTDSAHLQDRDAMTLSGGERARVLMARALAAEPSLLLADEPVSSLDLGHQLQTMDVLRKFASGNCACIVVLHDLSLAARYCDRLYMLDQGKLTAEGSAASVLSNNNIREVYGVDVITGGDVIPWIIPHQRVSKQD